MEGLTQYLRVDEERPRGNFLCLVCLHGISIFLLTTICVVVMIALSDIARLVSDAHQELDDFSELIPKAQ